MATPWFQGRTPHSCEQFSLRVDNLLFIICASLQGRAAKLTLQPDQPTTPTMRLPTPRVDLLTARRLAQRHGAAATVTAAQKAVLMDGAPPGAPVS